MNLLAQPEVVEVVRFRSGELRLDGRFTYHESEAPIGGVVIAGPHPLLGGDVENNVVRGVSVGLARLGVPVLAFNYRGVGSSEGSPPDIARHLAEFWANSQVTEQAEYAVDLKAAVNAFRQMIGISVPLAVVGYSFGCSILPTSGVEPHRPMVLIAPTVGTHKYAAYQAVPNPLLVIAPDGDFATQDNQLAEWFDSLTAPKRLIRGEWDDHFFRGHEERLADLVFDFLLEQWEGFECR